jgi:hypothetical protein
MMNSRQKPPLILMLKDLYFPRPCNSNFKAGLITAPSLGSVMLVVVSKTRLSRASQSKGEKCVWFPDKGEKIHDDIDLRYPHFS